MPKRQAPISNQEADLINDIAGYELDPFGYVMYAYPWGDGELADYDGPDVWQAKVLVDIGDKLQKGLLSNFAEVVREAVASGHGVGKSALVAWLVDWAMDTYEDTRGIVTANTDTQLRTKTWPEVQKWSRLRLTSHWTTVTATAIYSNTPEHEANWRIDAIPWSKDRPESFAGLHNKGKRILMIFDEGSAIEDIIFEVAEGAMTDENTQIIWCVFGNPTRNTGRFRECWRKFIRMWQTWQVDSRDAKMANKRLIDEWIDAYGIDSDFVKVRVRGMFPTLSAKQFISTDDVDKAYGKQLRAEQYSFAPVIITCDPAAEGDDMLEIAKRQGLFFTILRTIPKNDNDIHIANILANMEDEHQADAVFIDGGFGTGIVSAGRTMGRSWQIVWFAGESSDPGCLNKRAEMYKSARDWLKQGGAIPENYELYEELTGIETVPRLDGKIQLEAKRDYKKRLGRSPGKADALVLSFAFPVTKRTNATVKRDGGYFAKSDYNPLDRRR